MASNRFSRLVKIFTGTNNGAEEELLQLEGRLERTAHFWTLVARHFVRNRCLIRASSLAYTTLLALIPLLAVVISISTSLLKTVPEDKFYDAIASIAPAVAYPAQTSKTVSTNSATPAGTNSPSENILEANTTTTASETNALVATPPPPPSETQVTVQKELARQLRGFVQNTQGATLGVTGMIVFVFIAIMMLSRIEETFNDIWGVARGRRPRCR